MNIRTDIQMAFCAAGEFSLAFPNHETVERGETCQIKNQLVAERFFSKTYLHTLISKFCSFETELTSHKETRMHILEGKELPDIF